MVTVEYKITVLIVSEVFITGYDVSDGEVWCFE